MTYVFDIDGTLCTKATDFDYDGSEPIQERIDVVNRLYDEGHTIIMQTARGMGRCKIPRFIFRKTGRRHIYRR